jgi:calcium permeable stress-gated cation channel
MFLFLIPVTFIQGFTQLEQLQQRLPNLLRGVLKRTPFQLALTSVVFLNIIMIQDIQQVAPHTLIDSKCDPV